MEKFIIEKRKDPKKPFLIFEDPRVSYRDIGLYLYMVRHAEDRILSLPFLAERHTEKYAATKSSLDHLIQCGYVSRDKKQTRDQRGGFAGYIYRIYEDPFDNPEFRQVSIPCQ